MPPPRFAQFGLLAVDVIQEGDALTAGAVVVSAKQAAAHAADGQCTTGDRASGGVRPCDLIGRGTGSVEFLAQIYSGTDPCGEIIAGDGLFGLLDLKVDRSGVQLQLEVAASGQRAEFDEVAEP